MRAARVDVGVDDLMLGSSACFCVCSCGDVCFVILGTRTSDCVNITHTGPVLAGIEHGYLTNGAQFVMMVSTYIVMYCCAGLCDLSFDWLLCSCMTRLG